MGGWEGDKIKRQKPCGEASNRIAICLGRAEACFVPLPVYKSSGRSNLERAHGPKKNCRRCTAGGLDSGCGPDLCAGAVRGDSDSPQQSLIGGSAPLTCPTCRGGQSGSGRMAAALGTVLQVVPRDWSFLTAHGFATWPTPEARLLTHGNLNAAQREPGPGSWHVGSG